MAGRRYFSKTGLIARVTSSIDFVPPRRKAVRCNQLFPETVRGISMQGVIGVPGERLKLVRTQIDSQVVSAGLFPGIEAGS